MGLLTEALAPRTPRAAAPSPVTRLLNRLKRTAISRDAALDSLTQPEVEDWAAGNGLSLSPKRRAFVGVHYPTPSGTSVFACSCGWEGMAPCPRSPRVARMSGKKK